MGAEELLLRVIDKSHRQKAIRTIGMGSASQITENNCVVLRDGQPELHDVRFHATETKPGSRIVEIPADNSSVIYAIIENQATEAVILKCSEIEKVIIEVDKAKYEVNKNGISMVADDAKYELDASGHLIAKGSDTLGYVLQKFIEIVQKIIVVNGKGPDIAALSNLSIQLSKILK